jgi:hypothetical protein
MPGRSSARGFPVRAEAEDVARLSPLVHDHIDLLGRYTSSVPEAVERGRIRLKMPNAPKWLKFCRAIFPSVKNVRAEPELFNKNGILSKVTASQSHKTGDSDAPKNTTQGAKCQKFTHERGTLTVLERWAHCRFSQILR